MIFFQRNATAGHFGYIVKADIRWKGLEALSCYIFIKGSNFSVHGEWKSNFIHHFGTLGNIPNGHQRPLIWLLGSQYGRIRCSELRAAVMSSGSSFQHGSILECRVNLKFTSKFTSMYELIEDIPLIFQFSSVLHIKSWEGFGQDVVIINFAWNISLNILTPPPKCWRQIQAKDLMSINDQPFAIPWDQIWTPMW